MAISSNLKSTGPVGHNITLTLRKKTQEGTPKSKSERSKRMGLALPTTSPGRPAVCLRGKARPPAEGVVRSHHGELQEDNAELSVRVLYTCNSPPCSLFVKCVRVSKAAIRWMVVAKPPPLEPATQGKSTPRSCLILLLLDAHFVPLFCSFHPHPRAFLTPTVLILPPPPPQDDVQEPTTLGPPGRGLCLHGPYAQQH